jgi:peroxidase
MLLDQQYLVQYDLVLVTDGFYRGYNHQVQPIVSNEWAAAAHRFGHSLIQGTIQRCTSNFGNIPTGLTLGAEFFNVSYVRDVPGGADDILRGLIQQPALDVDIYFTSQVTENLYQTVNPISGLDLVATNIQRGRDNGIAGYNAYRKFCNLTTFSSFSDMSSEMNKSVIPVLQSFYNSVDDIDLYIGGLLEYHVGTGLLGPTFSCIIGLQFQYLRQGDRFWYENNNQAGSFTEDQLAEIRNTSLSQVMCNNLDQVLTIQPLAMQVPGPNNERAGCSALGSEDLSSWTTNTEPATTSNYKKKTTTKANKKKTTKKRSTDRNKKPNKLPPRGKR